MKIDGNAIEFFESIPDDILVKIAMYDWGALERLCTALTLDIQLLKESYDKKEKVYKYEV